MKKLVLSSVLSLLTFSSFTFAEYSTVDAILSIPQSISNWFGILIRTISNFFSSVGNILSYIGEILQTLRFGLISICGGIWDLIMDFFGGTALQSVLLTFDDIAGYIGGPATVFIITLLMIAMFRIFIGFIFKILRLNLDYHTLNSKTSRWNQKDRYGI